jgi:hypothetical protein
MSVAYFAGGVNSHLHAAEFLHWTRDHAKTRDRAACVVRQGPSSRADIVPDRRRSALRNAGIDISDRIGIMQDAMGAGTQVAKGNGL